MCLPSLAKYIDFYVNRTYQNKINTKIIERQKSIVITNQKSIVTRNTEKTLPIQILISKIIITLPLQIQISKIIIL